MAALTENDIIDIIYSMYESDTTGWDPLSTEYIVARSLCNAAINQWEGYDNTDWRELWTSFSDAGVESGVEKTTTAGTYS
jgi:hypothetical protein